ncbi:transcription cofactor vestigial-like protein 4 [Ictidomys tridecemlineatus]
METPLDVLSRAASLVHADDEKREAALRGESRMQTLPVASALSSHRTGPPPISPSKRKFSMEPGDEDLNCENDHVSKMSRMFNPHIYSERTEILMGTRIKVASFINITSSAMTLPNAQRWSFPRASLLNEPGQVLPMCPTQTMARTSLHRGRPFLEPLQFAVGETQ